MKLIDAWTQAIERVVGYWSATDYQQISPILDRVGVGGAAVAVTPEMADRAGLTSGMTSTGEIAAILGICVSVMWIIKLGFDIFCRAWRWWHVERVNPGAPSE